MIFRKAINATCRECIYDPYADGTWRKQVEGCIQTYPVNRLDQLLPYKRKRDKDLTDAV